MVKKIKKKRKRKLRSRESDATRKTRIVFYHTAVFDYLHGLLADEIYEAVIERPREVLAEYWAGTCANASLEADEAWDRLRAYLDFVESKMATAVARRSAYWWIHFYRRIGVALSRSHRAQSDPVTVALVRQIMEAAFIKYGQVKTDDMARTSLVASSQVLGGWFEEVVRAELSSFPERADDLISQVMASDSSVMIEFSDSDLVDLYALEGLAYEYWATLATMRSVGKGAGVRVDHDGVPRAVGPKSLKTLIDSYDRRSWPHPFSTSLAGAGLLPGSRGEGRKVLVPSYNVERTPFADLPQIDGVELEATPNFVFGVLDIDAYVASHEFLNDAFRVKHGFGVDDLCDYLYAVLLRAMSSLSKPRQPAEVASMISLYQRAYECAPQWKDEFGPSLLDWTSLTDERKQELESVLPLIRDYLTLTETARDRTSLWTGGPRYLFVPVEIEGCLIDYQAVVSILHTLFVGLRHDQGAKGETFEDGIRRWFTTKGLDVLQERELRALDSTKREVDVAVRVGDVLFLCECRAMERPLDFELGRPKTIERRSEDLATKVEQVNSLQEFVLDKVVGKNYDFSWAARVVSFVVSPFVEWMWTEDKGCWLDSELPAVLSPFEAVTLMQDVARHAQVGTPIEAP